MSADQRAGNGGRRENAEQDPENAGHRRENAEYRRENADNPANDKLAERAYKNY